MLIGVKVVDVERVNDGLYRIVGVRISKNTIENFMLNYMVDNQIGNRFTDAKQDIETINHLFD